MILVLDAMGVVYSIADDFKNLLVPFLRRNGCQRDYRDIWMRFCQACEGRISADDFWLTMAIRPELEDSYLRLHKLGDGVRDVLRSAGGAFDEVWGFSNDVSRWSRALRALHGIEKYFNGFVVSSEVGHRKPHAAMYQQLLSEIRCPGQSILYVDDRERNLDEGRKFGFKTLAYAPHERRSGGHRRISSLEDVLEINV